MTDNAQSDQPKEVPQQDPIFILWTRSFWLSVVGVAVLLAGDITAIHSLVGLIAPLFGLDPAPIANWMVRAAPGVLFIAALFERSGSARPYTANPRVPGALY